MGRYQDASFAGHSTASQLPEPIFPLNLIKIILPLRMMIQLESWYRVTESYSGENVGHRPGERAAVLHRATIGITEIAIRFQNEITLAATITPRPRTMRDDRRPPTLRNCTELSTAPRVSARAFPVDANLRDLARLHAGHGAILRFNQSLGYGKLLQCHPTAVRRGVSGFRVAKHLHLPITHDKQAETAGRERYDALVGERTELFWDGLIRRRVVLLSTAVELDVAVDRDDASDAT